MSTRRRLFPFWFSLLFGLMGVARIVGNPRLAAIRAVDIVQLLAIGLCFGVALTTLVTFLRRRRDRQE
jgi:hypothetical protein